MNDDFCISGSIPRSLREASGTFSFDLMSLDLISALYPDFSAPALVFQQVRRRSDDTKAAAFHVRDEGCRQRLNAFLRRLLECPFVVGEACIGSWFVIDEQSYAWLGGDDLFHKEFSLSDTPHPSTMTGDPS